MIIKIVNNPFNQRIQEYCYLDIDNKEVHWLKFISMTSTKDIQHIEQEYGDKIMYLPSFSIGRSNKKEKTFMIVLEDKRDMDEDLLSGLLEWYDYELTSKQKVMIRISYA